MHTKDKLAEALNKCGLNEMAIKAGNGYYHDYLSPLATPELQLINDLYQASLGFPAKDLILKLRQQVIDGDFDASHEESEQWMESPEGQQIMRDLINTGKLH
jgi:hypothetical protein